VRPVSRSGLLVLSAALIPLPGAGFAGSPLRAHHPLGQDSADSPRRSVPKIVVDDLGITLRDAAGFFTAPFSFDRKDVDRLLAWTGTVGITMAMDEPLNNLMVTYPPPEGLTGALDWGEEWGRLRTMQYASLGVYLGGLALGEDDIRVTGRLMGEAILLAGVPAITLQYTFGRSRPYSGKGAFDYNFFEWSNEYQSLPSGHATVAFAISTVLAKRIDRWWVSVPLYASAGLTVLSLGWNNQHWPSDLFIGATLGYLAGSFVVGREEDRSVGPAAAGGGRRWYDGFEAGFGSGGISVRYRLE
jgi:membrane-associated phospholipid phosphatase